MTAEDRDGILNKHRFNAIPKTAEEKLQELYERENEVPVTQMDKDGGVAIHVCTSGGIYISAEHIDLIANLVIERIRNEATK